MNRVTLRNYAREKDVSFYEFFTLWCLSVGKRPSVLTTKDVDQFVIDRSQGKDWYAKLVKDGTGN